MCPHCVLEWGWTLLLFIPFAKPLLTRLRAWWHRRHGCAGPECHHQEVVTPMTKEEPGG